MRCLTRFSLLIGLFCVLSASAREGSRQSDLAHELFRQLIDINTTDSSGSVTAASQAMAQRLRAAGFPASDVQVVGRNDRKKNLVVRLHGSGHKPPVLFIGHLDVVEAPRLDWSTDPFKLTVKDGYYYGRGTQDMKSGDAIAVASLIRLREEHFKPDRDIIVALTAGEESFKDNGVKWLTENRRDLINAAFVINLDAGGVVSEHGKVTTVRVDAAEKLYADFRLSVLNPGGTTAYPRPDNAIYTLARGLTRIEQLHFPFELNPVTRAYFRQIAQTSAPPISAELHGMLSQPPDEHAIAQLSRDAQYNAFSHTVCTASRLEAGHANNAQPQQAIAIVNCRILPGHSAEEVRRELVRALADPTIKVSYVREFDGREFETAPAAVALKAMVPPTEVMDAVRTVSSSMWPAAPVVITMSAGESDGVWATAAGIPTFGVNGLAIDRDDVRAHGKDERVRISSFDKDVEFEYSFIKALTTAR